MRMQLAKASVTGLAALVLAAGHAPAREAPTRDFAVAMVDRSPTEFAFEPTRLVVRPGDVLRFRQQGVMPHNVEFKSAPDGAKLGDARVGPFLLAKGETYELVIDERFVPGEYRFVCTPHETMGMKGVLIVEDPTDS